MALSSIFLSQPLEFWSPHDSTLCSVAAAPRCVPSGSGPGFPLCPLDSTDSGVSDNSSLTGGLSWFGLYTCLWRHVRSVLASLGGDDGVSFAAGF